MRLIKLVRNLTSTITIYSDGSIIESVDVAPLCSSDDMKGGVKYYIYLICLELVDTNLLIQIAW